MAKNDELIEQIFDIAIEKNLEEPKVDGLSNPELQALLKEVKEAKKVELPDEEEEETEPMPDFVIARGKSIVRKAVITSEGEEVKKAMFDPESWKAHLKAGNIVKGSKY